MEVGEEKYIYTYDSWGKLLGITDANGNAITAFNSVAVLNPIRYRGYFYDTETGFYYLNSRYYDPQIGWFINADDVNILDIDQRELFTVSFICLLPE